MDNNYKDKKIGRSPNFNKYFINDASNSVSKNDIRIDCSNEKVKISNEYINFFLSVIFMYIFVI